MTVAYLAGEKIGGQKIKDDTLFLLNKSQKFQNQLKVNIVKQRNIVFIHNHIA